VVTSLYRMELARAGGVRVIEPEANAVGHSTLPDPEAALEMARKHDADYVVRGQVVEFRRAISEPNAWGSFFSPTVLAARFIVADVSGVDIATELYRVADGACILARRDRSHQKYVVRAENTVRVLAQRTAPVMAALMQTEEAATVEPIIESIELPPATPRSGAAGEEEEAPADAPAEEEDE
jgi:hypothetical protein